jgi:hypothetical protein
MVENKKSTIVIFFNGFLAGFKRFSLGVAIIVNFILLFIVYLLGVGLTSLTAKIFRKHFLDIAPKHRGKSIKSYWKEKKDNPDNEQYNNQF